MWVISVVAALAVIGLAVVPRVRRRAWLGAGLTFAFGALTTAYVFGPDRYRNDGRSNWATHGGASDTTYLVAMGIVAVCTATLAFLAARGTQGRIVRPVLVLSGGADVLLAYFLILAFANN